jgi:hypothetical protein
MNWQSFGQNAIPPVLNSNLLPHRVAFADLGILRNLTPENYGMIHTYCTAMCTCYWPACYSVILAIVNESGKVSRSSRQVG